MSSDELDSCLEKDQFEQLYQSKLGKKMEKKNQDNYEHSLQQLVNEIIHHPKDPKDKEKHTVSKVNKRPKWDTKSTKLFFKLYDFYSGDMSMITQFFREHTEYKFEQKQVNRKYNQELKKNPELVKSTPKQQMHHKINKKLKQLEEQEPNLKKQISLISVISRFHRQSYNPWSLQGFQQSYKLIKQKQQLIYPMESLHSSCTKSEQPKWQSPKETNNKFKKKANIYQQMEITDNIAFLQLQPDGPSYILTNLNKQYLCQYNKILKDYISEIEFRDFILEINAILIKYWPSKYIIYLAYILILFTAGFSLLLPMCCLNQAEKYVQWKIDEFNIKWESRCIYAAFHQGRLTLFLKSRFNQNSLEEVYDDEVLE